MTHEFTLKAREAALYLLCSRPAYLVGPGTQ